MLSFLSMMRAHENEKLVQAHGTTIAAQEIRIAANKAYAAQLERTIEAHEATIRAKDAEIESLRSLVRHLELTVARIRHPAYPTHG